MSDFNLEKKYASFFAAVVKLFITVMIFSFIYHAAEILMNPETGEKYISILLDGEKTSQVLFSFKMLIICIRLLSSSIIISFSYLSYLFFKKNEFLYSGITLLIVVIILLSAFLSSFI